MGQQGNEAEELEVEGTEVDEEIEEGAAVPELDDDGNEVQPEIEAWMQEEDPEEEADEQQGKKPKLSTKQKLRGKVADRDETIEKLERRLAEVEKGKQPDSTATAKRPRQDDFDSDEDFDTAMDTWIDERIESKTSTFHSGNKEQEASAQHAQATESAVDDHYTRAEKLIEQHKINPDTYKASDMAVRQAVEQIFPKNGDAYVDQFIANLGEGSEKVMHYIGINKAAMNEFRAILTDDPTGLKASIFLGKKLEQVSGTKTKLSQARKPAAKISGDEQPTATAGKLKKDYDKAGKTNNGQAAYNAKKAAKAQGIDTSKW